jgi:hypothetical protein
VKRKAKERTIIFVVNCVWQSYGIWEVRNNGRLRQGKYREENMWSRTEDKTMERSWTLEMHGRVGLANQKFVK